MSPIRPWLVLLLLFTGVIPTAAESDTAEQSIRIVGDHAGARIMTAWGQAFQEAHPSITCAVRSNGAASGLGELLDGSAQAAWIVRPLKDEEQEWLAESDPDGSVAIRPLLSDRYVVAVADAIPLQAVQHDHLVERLSAAAEGAPLHWRDFGLEGEAADRAIDVILPWGPEGRSSMQLWFEGARLYREGYRGNADLHNQGDRDHLIIGPSHQIPDGFRELTVRDGEEVRVYERRVKLLMRVDTEGNPQDPDLAAMLAWLHTADGAAFLTGKDCTMVDDPVTGTRAKQAP